MLRNEADITSNKLYENAFEWRFELPALLDEDGKFGGFDIVIGNPPYIQLQANGGFLAEQLKNAAYETFARTGDIYCLFYERGLQLLCDGGIETYITPNKWMRAGYGEKTRACFAKNNPLKLLDLGAGVFESATVDTNILVLQKGKNQNQLKAVVSNKIDFSNIPFIPMNINNRDIWTVLSPIEKNIKSKIEAVGTPLKDWDIKINFGIKTGYNVAFIIDTAKRDDLISQDPNNADIIKPLLRGRDINYYSSIPSNQYLICTFPAKNLDVENYPSIKNHFQSYGKRLFQTGESGCRKKTRNKWFETQDPIGYHSELLQPKIVWKRIGSILRFCYDDTASMVLDSTCFATGDGIKYLVALLNSKMGHYLLKDAPKTGTGDLLISVQALEPICVPKLSIGQQPFIEIADQILEAKKENPTADTTALEAQIDQMVYALYNLTEEEIKIIENK